MGPEMSVWSNGIKGERGGLKGVAYAYAGVLMVRYIGSEMVLWESSYLPTTIGLFHIQF